MQLYYLVEPFILENFKRSDTVNVLNYFLVDIDWFILKDKQSRDYSHGGIHYSQHQKHARNIVKDVCNNIKLNVTFKATNICKPLSRKYLSLPVCVIFAQSVLLLSTLAGRLAGLIK